MDEPALAFFFQGAALGLTAAASPGPLQTYLINQSLSGGWRGGVMVALAPLLSDPLIILLVLLLLNQTPAWFLSLVSLAGGLYAFFLAWGLWRRWRAGEGNLPEPDAPNNGGLRKAVAINFLSPGPYTFWALVCGPLLLSALNQSLPAGVSFLAGFYGLFLGGMALLAVLFSQARRLGPRLVRILLLSSILILAGFGLLLLVRGLGMIR